MPAFVKGKKDHSKWEQAKKAVLDGNKMYKGPDKWALVTSVYKKMGGKIARKKAIQNIREKGSK